MEERSVRDAGREALEDLPGWGQHVGRVVGDEGSQQPGPEQQDEGKDAETGVAKPARGGGFSLALLRGVCHLAPALDRRPLEGL